MPNKINNTFIVTVVDENGSKQFNIAKIAKKILIYAIFTILILIIIGYFVMTSISSKLDSITIAKNHAISEYHEFYNRNKILLDDIADKNNELNIINKKVQDFQSIVDIKNNTDKTKNQYLELDHLDENKTDMMLQIIPNGDPINSYVNKTQSMNKSFDSSLESNSQFNALDNNSGLIYFTKNKEPIFATSDGIIEISRKNFKYGYGNLIRIVHAFGFSSAYGYLSDVLVKKGEFVTKGQIIGYTSPSLNKPSLYYEIRFLGTKLNVLSFVDWNENNFEDIVKKNRMINFKSLIWAIDDISTLKSINSNYANNN